MYRIFLFLLLLAPVNLYAQLYSNKVNFQHVLDNRDVVLGVVLAIHQDSDGFVWFGGENGLVRFDGYVLKQVELLDSSGDTPQKKPVSMVADIFEDSLGTLWIASGNGLLSYDRTTERLITLPDHQSLAASPLSTLGVRKVTEMANGKIIAATYTGLYIVDRSTGEGKLYKTADGFSAGRINTVFHDQNNVLWVGTGSGLDRLDTQTGKITQYKPYAAAPDSVPDNGVSSLVKGDDGRFWLGTDNGLLHFNPATQDSQRYTRDPNNAKSFSGGDIWDLHLDANGLLWIATDGGGLNLLDPKTEQFVRFQYEAGRPGSLNSNVVRTVTEDRSGDIWVGNYPGGVNFFDKSSAAIVTFTTDPSDPTSLSYNSVMSIVDDSEGNIWVGTDSGGLNYFDRKTKKFTRYAHVKDDPNTVSANAVLSMLLDSHNVLWGGTWAGGIFQVDLNNNNRITRMPNDPKRAESKSISQSKKLNNDKVWCIVEDRQGYIWIGTHEGGLSRYDRKTGEYVHYVATDEPDSLSGNQVWTVYEDSTDTFWVGTTTGAGILDRETGKFSNFVFEEGKPGSLSSPSVLSIFEDSKNRLWLGTNGGLNLYHRDTNQFSSYGIKEGFFNDSIRSIVEDQQGRLWLGTNSGVTTFDPETAKIKNYNRESGKLVGGFNYNAGLMTKQGEAVFGGKAGLRIYDTQKMQDNILAPPIVLTDLKVLSDSVVIGDENGLLEKSVNVTSAITLDYTHSVIEFEFSALNYRDQNKNRYAYMLEGFDESWVNAGDQRRAKYTNLDSGKYVFRVKGSNNDGIWNEEGKRVQIIQLPPPWQTWWAYTLYTLAGLAIVLWFVQAQRKKRKVVEEQNRILEIRVAERTAEITKKNKDIENMLANMHQGLFTIEGNGAIHPEYSKFLESIFETSDVAGRNVIELLFTHSPAGSDLINQVQEAIGAIVGEDEMGFDFNSHLLVREYDIVVDDRVKYLSVDWNPILSGSNVDKLMVTVRDVTELRKMEAESKAQKRELDIIAQLLNIAAKKYLNFEKTTAAFIQENRQAIQSTTQKDQTSIELLFRNMHTIKGNCRTYGFTHVGNVVHEVESVYSALKADQDQPWDQQVLLQDLERVELAVVEYAKVYRDVLGRDDSAADRASGMWLDAKAIQSLQASIRNVQKLLPSIAESQAFKPISKLFSTALSSPLEVVLQDVVNSLPSIASQLGKEAPLVEFNCGGLRIKESYNELLNNVFAHVLRNSVDHGIEDPLARSHAGKPLQGRIVIHTPADAEQVQIHVIDDGRGLDINRLYEKGLETGRWREEDSPSAETIANLIFASGVSTKEEVTEISGRGVGMDAVKQFIQAKGGDIKLRLLKNQSEDATCAPFEIVLILPTDAYVFDVDEQPVAIQNI